MISYWINGKEIKLGESVTDGSRVLVLCRDGYFHQIGSGNHATHHTDKKKIDWLLEKATNNG